MKHIMISLLLVAVTCLVTPIKAFTVLQPFVSTTRVCAPSPTLLLAEPELSEPEQKVYDMVQDIHESSLPFRVVVIGNGAILESTNVLGPVCKVGQSPKTGENLCTLATEDKSFEFHLKLGQVSKVILADKERPDGSTMYVLRFLADTGSPICSLIAGGDAKDWFQTMQSKYGEEVQL